MYIVQQLHRFYFYDYQIVNNDVQTESHIKFYVFVIHGNAYLSH